MFMYLQYVSGCLSREAFLQFISTHRFESHFDTYFSDHTMDGVRVASLIVGAAFVLVSAVYLFLRNIYSCVITLYNNYFLNKI